MILCEATALRDGVNRAYPDGYQVSMANTYRYGWVLKIQRRGAGPHEPKRSLFTSLPFWICLPDEWPAAAERLGIDTYLVEQMGGAPLAPAGERFGEGAYPGGSDGGPPSAEPGTHPTKGASVCP